MDKDITGVDIILAKTVHVADFWLKTNSIVLVFFQGGLRDSKKMRGWMSAFLYAAIMVSAICGQIPETEQGSGTNMIITPAEAEHDASKYMYIMAGTSRRCLCQSDVCPTRDTSSS
jgi:hypothetical protein